MIPGASRDFSRDRGTQHQWQRAHVLTHWRAAIPPPVMLAPVASDQMTAI
jgi:hypothetical protein